MVVLKFLDAVDADIERGGLRDVDSYVSRFPSDAELIRSEYAKITAAEPPPEELRHRLIGGRYRVIESLGRGGFGEVFLAQDLQLDRRVAVKMLAGLRTISEEARTRLIREAEVSNRIGDEGICPVHDVGSHHGAPFLVMPWIAGRSLDRLIAASAALGEGPVLVGAGPGPSAESVRRRRDRLLRLVERVARSLQKAHEVGVVHRDVKPANILVRPDGRPVLIDFGLASLQSAEDALTRSGSLGTPAYAAPEALHAGRTDPDPRLDVWSLGAVLFEGLMLRRPFVAQPGTSLERTVLEAPAPQLAAALGRDLQAVVETALCRRPAHRYATMGAFADDLARVRKGEPVTVLAAGRLRRLWQQARARPRAMALAVVIGATTVTAIVLGATLYFRAREHEVVAAAVTMLAASLDDVVTDSERLARFGFVIEDRATRVEALLTTVRELRDGVGADPGLDRSMARVLVAAAGLQLQLGQVDQATRQLVEAKQLLDRLVSAGVAGSEDRAAIAHILILLGDARSHVGDASDALDYFRQAFAIDAQLLAEEPGNATRVSNVGFGHLRIGYMLSRLDRLDSVPSEQERAVALLLQAEQLEPDDLQRQHHTADAMAHLANSLRKLGRPADQITPWMDQIDARLQRITEAHPFDSEAWIQASGALALREELSDDVDERGRIASLRVAYARRVAALEPAAPYKRDVLTENLHALALALAAAGRVPEALVAVDEAVLLARELYEQSPAVWVFVQRLAGSLATAAAIRRQAGEPDQADQLEEQLLAFVEKAWRRPGMDPGLLAEMGDTLLAAKLVRVEDARRRLLALIDETAKRGPLAAGLVALRERLR